MNRPMTTTPTHPEELAMQWEVPQPPLWRDVGFNVRCTTVISKVGAITPFIRHTLSGKGQITMSARSSMFLDPEFLTEQEARRIHMELDEHVDLFDRPVLSVYGKKSMIPRSQLAFGDGMYSYSNITVDAFPPPPAMHRFLSTIQQLTGNKGFRYALVNRYEDGTQKIGRHADDESNLARDAPIISYSTGESRRFVIRPKKSMYLATRKERGDQQQSKSPAGPSSLNPIFTPAECPGVPIDRTDLHTLPYHRVSIEVAAAHNTMLCMNGGFQRDFVHEVPAEKSAKGVRYNVTARAVNT